MRRQGERPELIRWRFCGTNKTWSFVPRNEGRLQRLATTSDGSSTSYGLMPAGPECKETQRTILYHDSDSVSPVLKSGQLPFIKRGPDESPILVRRLA